MGKTISHSHPIRTVTRLFNKSANLLRGQSLLYKRRGLQDMGDVTLFPLIFYRPSFFCLRFTLRLCF